MLFKYDYFYMCKIVVIQCETNIPFILCSAVVCLRSWSTKTYPDSKWGQAGIAPFVLGSDNVHHGVVSQRNRRFFSAAISNYYRFTMSILCL